MKKVSVIILGLCISFGASAADLPYLENVSRNFLEKERVVNELYNQFESENVAILSFHSNGDVSFKESMNSDPAPYVGSKKDSYFEYLGKLWPLNVRDILREKDRLSITVATALRDSAFVEVELNRYFEKPEIAQCDQPDLSKNGICLVHLKDQWYLTYIWFVS